MKPVWTSGQIVAQLTNWGTRWNNQVAVPYTFLTHTYSWLGSTPNFSAFSSQQRLALARDKQLVRRAGRATTSSSPTNCRTG